MVDGVVAGEVATLAVEHAKILGDLGDLVGRAVQAEETLVEHRHVFGQQCRRITLGVDGDEQDLKPVAIRAELAHDLAHAGKGGGTDIRTLGVAKEDGDDLALEVGQGARLTMMVGELQGLAVFGAGDVGAAKHRL